MVDLQPSDACLAFIKKRESIRLKAYLCENGKPTIGWGHTRTVTKKDVTSGRTITREMAESLFKDDVNRFSVGVAKLCDPDTTQGQFDAMVSLAFNIGLGQKGFAGSTVLKRHNSNNWPGAAEAFLWWNKVRDKKDRTKLVESEGLTARRKLESEMYLDASPAYVEAPNLPPLTKSRTMNGGAVATLGSAAGAIAIITEVINQGAHQLEPMQESHIYIKYAFMILSILGMLGGMLVMYARHDDRKKNKY